jgi:hypothetical protein
MTADIRRGVFETIGCKRRRYCRFQPGRQGRAALSKPAGILAVKRIF